MPKSSNPLSKRSVTSSAFPLYRLIMDAGMVFLELLGKGVEQVCAAGQGDVQEGRVDVLDDVIDQRVFEAGKAPHRHGRP